MIRKIKRNLPLIFLILSLTGLILLVSWFLVRGAEFRLMKELPAEVEIDCHKMNWNPAAGETETEEIHLTREQLTEVLNLVRKNAYWRVLGNTIYHHENVNYDIICTFTQDSRTEHLMISVIGNYAVVVANSTEDTADKGFLRILDKDFLEKLEAILAK